MLSPGRDLIVFLYIRDSPYDSVLSWIYPSCSSVHVFVAERSANSAQVNAHVIAEATGGQTLGEKLAAKHKEDEETEARSTSPLSWRLICDLTWVALTVGDFWTPCYS